jgi:hypothetical protein
LRPEIGPEDVDEEIRPSMPHESLHSGSSAHMFRLPIHLSAPANFVSAGIINLWVNHRRLPLAASRQRRLYLRSVHTVFLRAEPLVVFK